MGQIVGFKTALLAKKVGISIDSAYAYAGEGECNSAFDMTGEPYFEISAIKNAEENGFLDACLAPTQAALQRVLREQYNIHVWCEKQHKDLPDKYGYRVGEDLENSTLTFNNWSFEEALEEGLQDRLNFLLANLIYS